MVRLREYEEEGRFDMCGICGIFGRTQETHPIKKMMDVLAHRGPDGSGSYTDYHCALGHRRLAILDLSDKGSQPMHNEAMTVWSVVNGEIYNYKELRERLIGLGHQFNSDCDSEVLTHAYEQFGDGFVTKLRGMFALVVYDALRKRLILTRDPVGKKPLYYAMCYDQLVFASEIKALFEAGVPREVNYNAIPGWLLYQYSMGDQTLFRGVYKLLPGHTLIAESDGFRTTQYWKLPESSPHADGVHAIERLQELLTEATKLRLQSDVPVGAFLSGGVDSSAVTALYRVLYPGVIHTFTVDFGDGARSEVKFAGEVSRHLSTEHHEVEITPEMVARDLEKVTWHHDEPLGDAAVLCNYYLAKEAKKYITVALAGEGGDELFGGYPYHKFAGLIGLVNKLPLRRGAWHKVGSDMTSRLYRWHRILSLLDHRELGEGLLYPTTATSKRGVSWLLSDGKNGNRTAMYRGHETPSVYNQMLASDFLNLLPEKFLMKADKGTMAWAVEERLPLLDQEVVKFAFELDADLKKNKWVLRKAVGNLLPEKIASRPKQGFGTPVAKWMRTEPLRSRVADRLMNGGLLKEVCKPRALQKMTNWYLRQSGSGERALALDASNVVWSLFALQTWWDIWFGRSRCV